MICQYCGQPAKMVKGKTIYPHIRKLHRLNFYQCNICGAHVGCHKPNKKFKHDGTEPLGELANAQLRAARAYAHDEFDIIWREKFMSRKGAYQWLAQQLGIPRAACHIGMFNLEQCDQTTIACRAYYAKILEVLT